MTNKEEKDWKPIEAKPHTLQTTTRSIKIIFTLINLDGAGVSDVAEALDIPVSTVHMHLTNLWDNRLVIKENDVYYPSPVFIRIGDYVKSRRVEYERAEKYVRNLHAETGLPATFCVEEYGSLYPMTTVFGDHPELPHLQPGEREEQLHSTAPGKAILSELPEQRIENIISIRGLPEHTESTITDQEKLFDELEEIRKEGYAYEWEEAYGGITGLGAAISNENEVVGAFGIFGPTPTFENETLRQQIEAEFLKIINQIRFDYSTM